MSSLACLRSCSRLGCRGRRRVGMRLADMAISFRIARRPHNGRKKIGRESIEPVKDRWAQPFPRTGGARRAQWNHITEADSGHNACVRTSTLLTRVCERNRQARTHGEGQIAKSRPGDLEGTARLVQCRLPRPLDLPRRGAQLFTSADRVGQTLTQHPLIVRHEFPWQRLFVKALLTHKEYDGSVANGLETMR